MSCVYVCVTHVTVSFRLQMGSKKTAENTEVEKCTAPERIYKVQTKEQEICEVPASVIAMSKLVTTMLEDLSLQDDDTPIPIPNVSAPVFKKVVAWCEKHKADAKESKQKLEGWSEEFFKVEYPMLFEIIMAANYLDIPKLLDDGCKKIAHMMKGKTPDEIRTMFNITNDFTPEEEEEIRRENAWCEE
ncbi:S-phase kinase-associated protein 1 [Trichostrongylus colubriformis]|uniref:Skp1-related protein n=1 Tax=Trichostrongylus colubriformis TaxID=6319 RepID=A0AAN8J3L0_TRICO